MYIDDYFKLAKELINEPETCITVSKDWAQGRTVYGGLSAGILFAATKEHVASERVMRSAAINFVGPLLSEVPFSVSIEEIRSGKNVSQMQARAIQNDKICVVAQFCFGEDRVSKIEVPSVEEHGLSLPNKAKFIPQIPKVTPRFLRHFDLSIDEGSIPFTGRKTSNYSGWMRFKKPPHEISDAHIVCLIDTWPPAIIQMLKWPAPASTVSWNLEFIHPHRKLTPVDWFAYKVNTRQAANGYGHTEATIWDAHGEVIALSRQTVAVFG